MSPDAAIDWIVDGPTTLHGFDPDLVYVVVRTNTDDAELQRQIALVSTWDVEGERYAQMIVALPKLMAACQAVVDRWEHGDLAEAVRMCQEALTTVNPVVPASQGHQGAMPHTTRRVEYYRLWGGDSGTWDTDFIDISADTPDERIAAEVAEAVAKIKWRDEPPVITGVYHVSPVDEDIN